MAPRAGFASRTAALETYGVSSTPAARGSNPSHDKS